MRALVVQPDPQCDPGLIGECLVERGYRLDTASIVPPGSTEAPGVGWEAPDPRDWNVIVALGARWSAYDDVGLDPWLSAELKLLRTAHEAGVPVLGICFGGQALARALGGTVTRSRRPEVGWVDIQTDDPDLVASGPWFQWHFDRFAPPPGSIEIARNAAASQAFRIGRSLGIQFHPELTESILEGWLNSEGVKNVAATGADSEELRASTTVQMPAARRRAAHLLDAFLAMR